MSSDHEGSSGPLDPERYDRWFERAWGRYAFSVERDALLAALDRSKERSCSTSVAEHAGRWAPRVGAFRIAVLDLPHPPR
jgi:hypothetical protein